MKKLIIIIILLAVTFNSKAQYKEWSTPDAYLQFVPLAADLFLGFGVEHKSSTADRFVAAGVGLASNVLLVKSLKLIVKEERPDGSDYDSFPSGHTSYAFLGAELIRHEYGWGWGAGAYAVATGVAVLRVCHHRHYWWDTLAGAGCGFLCANIGYWSLKPIHKLFKWDLPEEINVALVPTADVFSKSYGVSFQMTF